MTTDQKIEKVMLLVAAFYGTRWQNIRHSEMVVYILTCAIPKRTVADTIHLPLPHINEMLKVWNDKYAHTEYYLKHARLILDIIEQDETPVAA